MNILVSANNTNGNLPGVEEWFDTVEQAKKHADWLHGQSAVCNVEISEPLGVLLTHGNGTKVFARAGSMHEALEARISWKGVIANRKINRTRVRSVEIVGIPPRSDKTTKEDHLIGGWMALALEDIKILPSMKFDLNRWFDSKEWV